MSQSKITDLFEKLKELEAILAIAKEDVPHHLAAGHDLRRANARVTIADLKHQIGEATVPGRLIGFFISGPQEKLAEIEAFMPENDGIFVNAGKWYDAMAEEIESSYGTSREFGLLQFGAFSRHVRHLAFDLKVASMDSPEYAVARCASPEETSAHCRKMLFDAVGDYFTSTSVRNDILAATVKNQLDAAKIPVVVTNVAPYEMVALASLFSQSVEAVVDENFVVSQESISGLIRSKTEETKKPEKPAPEEKKSKGKEKDGK